MALNLQREYNKLAKTLEDAYKSEIKKQDLVDTGSLLRSFSVSVDLSRTKQVFKLEANDYFQYLDEEYSITKNVLKSSGFRKFETQLAEVYNLIIYDALGAS